MSSENPRQSGAFGAGDDVPAGSITVMLSRLKGGDATAYTPLWNRYFARLVELASARLPRGRQRMVDGEDVALCALKSFFELLRNGELKKGLENRDDLWEVLVMLTARKACDEIRHELRQKRGNGQVQREADFHRPSADSTSEAFLLEQVEGGEPTPEFLAMLTDECNRSLARLPDDMSRQIALMKLHGMQEAEIADKLGLCKRTIRRKVKIIRIRWNVADDSSA